MSIKDAAEQLAAALRLVPGMSEGSVYTHPAAPNLRCPALVIGPPGLDFDEAPTPDPTQARFPIYAVVDESARAVEELWELVPLVSAAVDEHTSGVIVSAEPFPFPYGTTDLPSYQLIAEVPL